MEQEALLRDCKASCDRVRDRLRHMGVENDADATTVLRRAAEAEADMQEAESLLRHAEACSARSSMSASQRQALEERRADMAALRRQLSGVQQRLQQEQLGHQQQQQQQQPGSRGVAMAAGSGGGTGGLATTISATTRSNSRVPAAAAPAAAGSRLPAAAPSSDAHRARALAMTERLQASSARLHEGRRQLAEAEATGASVLAELARQREQIQATQGTLDEAGGSLKRAEGVLKTMVRRTKWWPFG